MSSNGLEVFDKTVQITNTWLGEIGADMAIDRQAAWHALGTVLRAVRDRLPIGLAAHLGAQLPLLVRGAYYEQFKPTTELRAYRTADEFLDVIADGLRGIEDVVDPDEAARAVFRVLNHYIDPGQASNVREALPAEVRSLWPEGAGQQSFGSAA
jgi:uncharacterized protein (DUF2267 family)